MKYLKGVVPRTAEQLSARKAGIYFFLSSSRKVFGPQIDRKSFFFFGGGVEVDR